VTQQTLYNSLGQAVVGDDSLQGAEAGFSFTTGASSAFLENIVLSLADLTPGDGGQVTVLLSNAPVNTLSDPPLETIGFIQDSALTPSGGAVSLVSPPGFVLAPNTTYWIELEASSTSGAAIGFEAGNAGTGVANGSFNFGSTVSPNAFGADVAEVTASAPAPIAEYDTTSQPTAAGPLSLGGARAGFSFSAGASLGYLSAVTIAMQATNPGDGDQTTFALYDSELGAGGQYGPVKQLAVLGTVADSSLTTAQQLVTVNVSGRVFLTANTQYWIQAIAPNGSTAQIDFTQSGAGTGVSGQLYNTSPNTVVSDSATNGAVIAAVDVLPCFVAGVRIATTRGEIAVERLRVGDVALTASGGRRPIVWIGQREIDCRRHPDPAAVQPVRIDADAFGPGWPRRALWLSPGHNIVFDGALVPVGALVNGASVTQVARARVHYWHVELDVHDILIADGAPVESYLDCGNRRGFAHGADYGEAHPNFRPRHWRETCLPLALDGPAVVAARAHLLARVEAAGTAFTDDPDVHMSADGVRVEPLRLGETRFAFLLPAGTRALRLNSRRSEPPDRLPVP